MLLFNVSFSSEKESDATNGLSAVYFALQGTGVRLNTAGCHWLAPFFSAPSTAPGGTETAPVAAQGTSRGAKARLANNARALLRV